AYRTPDTITGTKAEITPDTATPSSSSMSGVMSGLVSVIMSAFVSAVSPAQQVEPWQIILPPQASIVYARDGSMIAEVGKEARFSVPLRTLPRYVGQAFVAVEDQRFYAHDG